MNLKKTLKIYAKCCCYCGKRFKDYSEKSIDHIVPRCRKNKATVLDNLIVCCKYCNNRKDSKDISVFINESMMLNIINYLNEMSRVNLRGLNYSNAIYRTLNNLLY